MENQVGQTVCVYCLESICGFMSTSIVMYLVSLFLIYPIVSRHFAYFDSLVRPGLGSNMLSHFGRDPDIS